MRIEITVTGKRFWEWSNITTTEFGLRSDVFEFNKENFDQRFSELKAGLQRMIEKELENSK